MKILICASVKKQKSIDTMPQVVDVLLEYDNEIYMLSDIRESYYDKRIIYSESEDIIENCDLILTVGGDGAILKWGKRAAEYDKPLIGINTGRLGFMTTLEPDKLEKLSFLMSGAYSVSRRMMMNAEIISGDSETNNTALNDVVLFKDVSSKLPEYIVRINGKTVTKIRADGLIFSTPTGSTAYALSAGGTIIEPTVECIQLTTLCAHSLFNRPMIFSGNDVISVSCRQYEGSQANITVDGGNPVPFGEGDELILTKSDKALRLIDIDGNSFYEAVRDKLMTPIK